MTPRSNDTEKNSKSQESNLLLGHSKAVDPPQKPAESWQDYLARVTAKGYQSPLINPDDSPLTLAEHLLCLLNTFDESPLPPEVWAELLLEALRAIASIPEEISYLASAVEALPDHTDQFNRALELWQETNGILRNIEKYLKEPPYPTYEESPPGSQGGRKPRTTEAEEPPGVKRLREGEKGGG